MLLVAVGSLLTEASTSLGKFAVGRKWEHESVMGLMNNIWTLGYFVVIIVLSPESFHIESATTPLLVLTTILIVMQTVATLSAVRLASRSTFGMIRTLTIPLVAGIDIFTGAPLSSSKLFATALMFGAAAWLYRNHGFSPRGALITLYTAVNAAITISLVKVILNMGTNIAAAQSIFITANCVVLFLWARKHASGKQAKLHANLLTLQSGAYGLGGLLESYALVLAPASIVTTASRALSVLWAIIFGKAVFEERHMREKIIAGCVIVIGLGLLAFGP